MTAWQDSADRFMGLLERYLRPMVEEAEARRDAEKARELVDEPEPRGLVAPGPFTGAFFRVARPAFTLRLVNPERDAVVMDDGTVLMWESHPLNRWERHSVLPGTIAATGPDA